MSEELRAYVHGARQMVKATQRTLRGTLQYLADLEERLDEELANAQSEEGTANGTGRHETEEVFRR